VVVAVVTRNQRNGDGSFELLPFFFCLWGGVLIEVGVGVQWSIEMDGPHGRLSLLMFPWLAGCLAFVFVDLDPLVSRERRGQTRQTVERGDSFRGLMA